MSEDRAGVTRVIKPGKSAYIHPLGTSRGMGSPGVLIDNETDITITVTIHAETGKQGE